eukprot:2096297-Amphidinium_carterae.1
MVLPEWSKAEMFVHDIGQGVPHIFASVASHLAHVGACCHSVDPQLLNTHSSLAEKLVTHVSKAATSRALWHEVGWGPH